VGLGVIEGGASAVLRDFHAEVAKFMAADTAIGQPVSKGKMFLCHSWCMGYLHHRVATSVLLDHPSVVPTSLPAIAGRQPNQSSKSGVVVLAFAEVVVFLSAPGLCVGATILATSASQEDLGARNEGGA
jgi:hypothetical protein